MIVYKLINIDVKYEEIHNKYGKKIADLVEAVSFNPKIEDKLE